MKQIFSKNACQEVLVGGSGSETGKGKKPISGELLRRLSRWATEAPPHPGAPGHKVKHTSELSTRRKGVGIFIYPLLSVLVKDSSQGKVSPPSSAFSREGGVTICRSLGPHPVEPWHPGFSIGTNIPVHMV